MGAPPPVASPLEYTKLVHAEVGKLGRYVTTRLRWHRTTRTVSIISAAAVPVLATLPTVPRGVLGLLGGLAAVAEAIGQLFQFQSAGLNAMRTANALERQLNLFAMGAGPYEGPRDAAFSRFVEAVEAIRETGDQAFAEVWQRQPTPTAEVGN